MSQPWTPCHEVLCVWAASVGTVNNFGLRHFTLKMLNIMYSVEIKVKNLTCFAIKNFPVGTFIWNWTDITGAVCVFLYVLGLCIRPTDVFDFKEVVPKKSVKRGEWCAVDEFSTMFLYNKRTGSWWLPEKWRIWMFGYHLYIVLVNLLHPLLVKNCI